MADVKFSELTTLAASAVATDDIFAVVDTSATTSKKLTVANLLGQVPSGAPLHINDTTDSTSGTSGAISTDGGLGVTLKSFLNGQVTFGTTVIPNASGTVDLGSAAKEFGDLYLGADKAIKFLADQSVTLTSSTGALTLNSTNKLQFGDTGTYIHQSADGVLDLVSDTELELNATTIDVNGAVDVAGATISGGALLPDGVGTRDLGSTAAEWGDLYLGDDAVIYLQADSSTTLTGSGDGILLNSTHQFQFGDTGTYIHQSADGVLDLVSDTELELNATTIDINGAVEMSGVVTVATGIIADAQDGAYLGSGTNQFSDLYLADGAQILFGDDSEVTLTHDADKGLTLKHTATSGAPTLTLAAGDTNIAINDVIGAIDFVAPDEGTGTDAITTAGSIRVISEGDFAADNNASKMSFMLGSSGAASEVLSVSSGGNLTVSGNLVVSGTTTTVSSTTIEVNDPLLFLAQNNTGSDAVDIGFFGTYDTSGSQDLFAGLFRDANDGKFRLFKDSQAEPTTTVNTGATGYAVATLVANVEGNVNGDLTGTLQTAAQGNVTSLGTLTALTVDNIAMDGSTIGHTSDTDLMTLADGIVTVAGEISVTTLDIGGTNVTSTAAELNILDGVTATASEINLIDGDASVAAGAAVADGDGLLLNDAGTMRMTTVQNLAAYFDDEITAMPNLVQSGALNAGSITSGFGTIDTGSSAISTTGVLTGGSIVITDESVIGTTDTDAIRIGAGGSVAFSNNTVLYGASNSTVATASTQTFSGTIGAGAPAAVVFTFKAKDGTSGTIVTGATNYQGGEIILTLKKGTDVETKKIMIHHDGDPSLDGTDVFITEFATLGTELGETLATSMGDADGTSLSANSDKHVHFKITNPSGTDAMTYAGVAHLVEIPGDS